MRKLIVAVMSFMVYFPVMIFANLTIGPVLDLLTSMAPGISGVDMKFVSQVLPYFSYFSNAQYLITVAMVIWLVIIAISPAEYTRETF